MELVDILSEIRRVNPPHRLDVGEPDVKPPPQVFEYLKGLEYAPYGPSEGEPELRERVAELFKVDKNEVVVVSGGRHGLAALMWIFRKRGLITPKPYYSGYIEIASNFEIPLSFIETSRETGWIPSFSERGVYLVNYPNNPTGAVLPRHKVRELVDVAEFIISDEVYRDIVFEPFTSPLEFTSNVAVVYSFSKIFSVPGFRVGVVIAPRDIARAVVKFNRATINSAPPILQKAVAQLVPQIPKLGSLLSEIYRRRAELAERVLKLDFARPRGAFYLFPRVKCGSIEFFRGALKVGVSVLPGESFGDQGHVRIALVEPEDRLADAFDKLNGVCPT
ncbi:pyridoxal phosphate-dependent aminotransferase [Thermoproteus tenax]|uniref:Aminotransferase n=1 Tax=Thermoproteus tenax (strain ATCC 35583 / DSM 2078 / JCM 9277 / NBRC 100435 / Kra 1) TaxID=768679 RepID=G4RLC6_THETK|nr:pyridoxal phosphate-dependent aminotransferase [Thermoproteus tenax]CCC82371.1 aspartate aminotransferase [Thermoproteus tenax Kra 1]